MSTLTDLTDRAAAIALHERVVRSCPGQRVTLTAAAQVADAIAGDPKQLRAAWEILGPWALHQLDLMVLDEARVRRRTTLNGDDMDDAPAGEIIEPKTRPSWYQKLPLWQRSVEVGDTGRRKKLAELTHGDCQTIAQFYMRSSTKLREKGDTWAAISRALVGAETLKAAAGKLAKTTLSFLQDETGGEVGND